MNMLAGEILDSTAMPSVTEVVMLSSMCFVTSIEANLILLTSV